jgi:hypothetical protein
LTILLSFNISTKIYHLPLNTSLNSPGGACRIKSDAMLSCKK